MEHNCYFCGNKFELSFGHGSYRYGSCPKCWTGVSKDLIDKVVRGVKKNPPKEIIDFVASAFLNENNQETVMRFFQEHMATISWNWTAWDYGLIIFAWYLDSNGYEFSTIYRKGKFIINTKNHFKLLEDFAKSIGDFSYIKAVSFTKNKVNITMNMKLIEKMLEGQYERQKWSRDKRRRYC